MNQHLNESGISITELVMEQLIDKQITGHSYIQTQGDLLDKWHKKSLDNYLVKLCY